MKLKNFSVRNLFKGTFYARLYALAIHNMTLCDGIAGTISRSKRQTYFYSRNTIK